MSKTRIKKKKVKTLSVLVSLILLCGAGFFLYQAFNEIVNTYNLTKELRTAQSILEQIDNEAELEKAVQEILAESPEQVAQYKKGKTNVIQFLLGKVMAGTKGKANPKTVMELLQKLLK